MLNRWIRNPHGIFRSPHVALAMALQARSQKGGKKRAQGAEAAAPIAQEVAGLVGLAQPLLSAVATADTVGVSCICGRRLQA